MTIKDQFILLVTQESIGLEGIKKHRHTVQTEFLKEELPRVTKAPSLTKKGNDLSTAMEQLGTVTPPRSPEPVHIPEDPEPPLPKSTGLSPFLEDQPITPQDLPTPVGFMSLDDENPMAPAVVVTCPDPVEEPIETAFLYEPKLFLNFIVKIKCSFDETENLVPALKESGVFYVSRNPNLHLDNNTNSLFLDTDTNAATTYNSIVAKIKRKPFTTTDKNYGSKASVLMDKMENKFRNESKLYLDMLNKANIEKKFADTLYQSTNVILKLERRKRPTASTVGKIL
ncbi:hypothetical protein FQA39_LY03350 [Lamprigera yunnana]|nr:hypothetical protein FQA39_LY03350 [Lamprigera yunnana]